MAYTLKFDDDDDSMGWSSATAPICLHFYHIVIKVQKRHLLKIFTAGDEILIFNLGRMHGTRAVIAQSV
jgi:hypothetical protein